VEVTIILVGAHRAYLPADARRDGRVLLRCVGPSVTLAEVMRRLAMPADTPRIVFLDGETIGDDQVLSDGDAVTFVSPVGGG
jgi:sulfur carrier protein ThiS